jgi:hypothetical protein
LGNLRDERYEDCTCEHTDYGKRDRELDQGKAGRVSRA